MKKLTLILILASLSVYAQKGPSPTNFQVGDIFFTSQAYALDVAQPAPADFPELLQTKARYAPDVTLKLTYTISSKALTHYRYAIFKNNIKVYGAEGHVAIDQNQKVRVCTLPLLPTYTGSNSFPAEGTAENLRRQMGADKVVKTEQVWFTDQSDYLKKGLVVELYGPETLHQEILVSGNEIIHQADLLRYFNGPNDSVVSVKVFTPDPLTTAQVNYGAPYTDNNDSPSSLLDNQRQTKPLVLTYTNGFFHAENDYVKIMDFSAPNVQPVTSVSNQLFFTRDQDGFEDMNVMYHISNHREHLGQLGYPNLPNYRIEVDAHAINNADQSFFSTATVPGRLYFGEGGVDDAEDADVIIHEFTHSVIYVAAPSSNVSNERGCIEEALGDYFAASYSNSINNYNRQNVFDWDGHNEFWPGRVVESTKDYGQASFKNGNFYMHTDLFASPLMQLNNLLGRNTTDALVLEALFNLGINTNMSEMAGYIILSDSLLNGGVNSQVIHNAFAQRNITPTISIDEYGILKTQIQVFNTQGFAAGEPVMVASKGHPVIGYRFISLNGSVVKEGVPDLKNEVFEIAAPNLPAGIYLLTLTNSEGYQATYKLLRAN